MQTFCRHLESLEVQISVDLAWKMFIDGVSFDIADAEYAWFEYEHVTVPKRHTSSRVQSTSRLMFGFSFNCAGCWSSTRSERNNSITTQGWKEAGFCVKTIILSVFLLAANSIKRHYKGILIRNGALKGEESLHYHMKYQISSKKTKRDNRVTALVM